MTHTDVDVLRKRSTLTYTDVDVLRKRSTVTHTDVDVLRKEKYSDPHRSGCAKEREVH